MVTVLLCNKDTQPSQTCSEILKVTLFLFLYFTVAFLCIWGVLTRLDQLKIKVFAINAAISISQAKMPFEEFRTKPVPAPRH